MMADQACKNCKRIVESGNTCPICKGNDLTTAWNGLVIIYSVDDSAIAEEVGIKSPGRYAIRVKG
jgi:DNA-directed RNA polymerase subunit E"